MKFQDTVNVLLTKVKQLQQVNIKQMRPILTLRRRSYGVAKWPIYSNGIIPKEDGAGSFYYVHFLAKPYHKDYRYVNYNNS